MLSSKPRGTCGSISTQATNDFDPAYTHGVFVPIAAPEE